MSKFYITTPIYYVNASPHIGHAYTSIICDCLARFKRMLGHEVFYLTGTDEHGEKIKKAAEACDQDVKVFVDEVMGNFKNLWEKLNITHDHFVRTTDQTHKDTVKKVLTDLFEKGDIYKAMYKSFYCMPCESFWTDTQVKDANDKCPTCGRAVELIEEENYFFKLSKYEDWLKDYLKDPINADFVRPRIRYNEVMGFLENNKLTDLCISRPKSRVSWGIELPLDANYVVYVWFDALLNYISAIGYGQDDALFNKWWPANFQFIGKDILRHHAVFWPIMLKACGIEQPKVIFAHGWWKMGEEKMSKSLGNIVNPLDLIKEIGVDALRFFLLREISVGVDGNYSTTALINRINSDLANDVGNLVYRTLNMAEKYFEGAVKPDSINIPQEFSDSYEKLSNEYVKAMDNVDFTKALELVFTFIGVMNKYIEDIKPWTLNKEGKTQELEKFIYSLLEGIRIWAVYLYPFIPATAESIYKQLGLEGEKFNLLGKEKWGQQKGYQVKKDKPLFPRIELDVN